MNPTYDFHGQVALVTGASSGMGLATAQAFAQAGAAVVLADINEQGLRATTDDLTAAGHQAIAVTCDVSDEDQVAAMVERAVGQFGRLDLAFNNAGIQAPPTDAADEPAELFDRVNAINLRGVWACMKHELRQMRDVSTSIDEPGKKNVPICRAFEAAEGTRTIDLLHGKQTLIVRPDRFIPAYRPHRRLRRARVCLRFRRFSPEFWHPIGTETRGLAVHRFFSLARRPPR